MSESDGATRRLMMVKVIENVTGSWQSDGWTEAESWALEHDGTLVVTEPDGKGSVWNRDAWARIDYQYETSDHTEEASRALAEHRSMTLDAAADAVRRNR